MELNDTYLVFVQTEAEYFDVPYHRCRTGLNHLAFHTESTEHVDSLAQELRNRGIPILYSDRHPSAGGSQSYAVFFEDPDRIIGTVGLFWVSKAAKSMELAYAIDEPHWEMGSWSRLLALPSST